MSSAFSKNRKRHFLQFLTGLKKPVVIVFHTVLPNPDKAAEIQNKEIAETCESIIVMTHNSAEILINDYGLPEEKISVIAHGTHLVPHLSKRIL